MNIGNIFASMDHSQTVINILLNICYFEITALSYVVGIKVIQYDCNCLTG